MDAAEQLTELLQKMDFDRPLDIANQDDQLLYVPKLHSASGVNPVDELNLSIRTAMQPHTWLFTGHRGVGKSTELRRLAKELREKRFLVIVADVGEYLNLAEPISTESLLTTIVAALADGADGQLGGTHLANSYFQRFKSFLQTSMEVSEVDLKIPGDVVSAKVVLKRHTNFLQEIKQKVSTTLADFAANARDFALSVQQAAQAKGFQHTLLILDSLERLRVNTNEAQTCYEAIHRTFELHAEYLKLEHVHVVYSVPPYLPFLIPRIGSYFGVNVCTLPHVKVFERPAQTSGLHPAIQCQHGIDLMLQSVRKRYPRVEQLIPRAQLEQLAFASSGSLRDFFRLIRSTCSKAIVADMPVPLPDETSITLAQQVLRNEMPLAEDDKAWLRKVRETHGTGLASIKNLHELARLFDVGLILNFRNGDDWCDAHYLLHPQLQ